jgi:hypothetical protein
MRGPKALVRAVLGVLVAANLAATLMVFKPLGGSPQDLRQQLAALRGQIRQRQAGLAALRTVSSKVEKGRAEGDAFLKNYFLDERAASSSMLEALTKAAQDSKMKAKEHTFAAEPIEGSADLGMLTVNGNYEGTFADLMEFIQRLDRSRRLVVIESLQAQPQQTAGTLNVNMKLNLFVREVKSE